MHKGTIDELVTSPPILRQISDEAIKKNEDLPLEINVPSNTQHVERLIQLMAKNATRKATSKLRNGLCKATIHKAGYTGQDGAPGVINS